MFSLSDFIVKNLEENNVEYVFGIPGSQILPLYKSLSKSKIKHILTRHEQGAVHAADAYTRASGKFGVCISTGGPGAMNLIMGVSCAYKDSIPILVITGDNNYPVNYNDFQSIKINEVFNGITYKSFNPKDEEELKSNLKEALYLLKNGSYGPIHINLHENLLKKECEESILEVNIENLEKINIENVITRLKKSTKPILLVGGGANWGESKDKIYDFVIKNNIPLVTTFHGKGIVSEYEKLNLGIVGIRGLNEANYALLNSDLVISLGSKLSERTVKVFENINDLSSKLINVNLKDNTFKDSTFIKLDVNSFIDILNQEEYVKNSDWLDEIYSNKEERVVDGVSDSSLPLRPPYIINKIYEYNEDSYFLADAGSHTTWSLLLSEVSKPSQLIFSGGFGPMGYGVPGSIGVSLAKSDSKVIVINGDGDFQMNLQELATIKENDLNICIFILNNSKLGIIEQWEKLHGMSPYEVDLKSNPDFVKLAESYGIDSYKVETSDDLDSVLFKVSNSSKPALVEVLTRYEDIPLPKS